MLQSPGIPDAKPSVPHWLVFSENTFPAASLIVEVVFIEPDQVTFPDP